MGLVACPKDWETLARDTVNKCNDLVQQVVTVPHSEQTISLLDDVSDTLCQVLDTAEFCRNVHTDPAWRQAATAACLSLGSYVQGLNTHRGMYAALSSALRAPGARAGPPETRAVGLSLARDFERYGVHLDAGGQARMARLTAEAQSLGYELGQNLVDPGALQGFDLPSSLADVPGTLPSGTGVLARRGSQVTAWLAQMRQPRASLALVCRLAEDRQREDAASAWALSCSPRQALRGLDRLMTRLMGVRVRDAALSPGEGWAPGLAKLRVSEADGALLGTVYLDFQPRPGKFPGAAHFVLRCGRGHGTDAVQTPVLALVASLPADQAMHPSQLELLLHEWGHALHTLLSRTRHQHLSGTRGPLDMMEVPSHVFELYARDVQGLALLLDRPAAELEAAVRAQRAQRRTFSALTTLHQVHLGLLDQAMHSSRPPDEARLAGATAEVLGRHSPLADLGPHLPVYPQLRFGHLVGYGATYYSYLAAQSLSARLWRRHMEGEPAGRAAGEALRRNLFEPGGALPAGEALRRLLGRGAGEAGEAAPATIPDPGDLMLELGIEE
ncbi:Mitochondrial intermediate peptidase [Auxenochlorella protothecoides]|uniref:Mitochondrial intermediate peptidase n=1 Tax=Auxenochlorella protothecoides TaxID=3075 RepID=A0A087SD87_AUXPR|nr:Mitochondrial intermediate peptidase [Auxenochlorella protothecoides]KFM23691.1 Mitochondrial intermediate peptidase [Auxenochlorella protothecoides]